MSRPSNEPPAHRYAELCDRDRALPLESFLRECGELGVRDLTDVLLVDQRRRWQVGERLSAEAYFERFPALLTSEACAIDLIYQEFTLREKQGERPNAAEYISRFPKLATQVAIQLELHAAIEDSGTSQEAPSEPTPRDHVTEKDKIPWRIGRYRVQRLLGQGQFGFTYLAKDQQQGRPVIVKVPQAQWVASKRGSAAILLQARAVASLVHPHLVPIYDVGSATEFPVLIVSKFIEGKNLADQMRTSATTPHSLTTLFSAIADAIGFAHEHGFTHGHLKPANIQVDDQGVPHITDLGLSSPRMASPGAASPFDNRYQSPEWKRGEIPRVNAACDLYSLGAMLWEALTFDVASWPKAASVDPFEAGEQGLAELEALRRLCQWAMAPGPWDRPTSAGAWANELRGVGG